MNWRWLNRPFAMAFLRGAETPVGIRCIFMFNMLNLLAAVVSGIWLAVVGEWMVLGIGLVAIFAPPFLIGVLLMPSTPLDMCAVALAEGGKKKIAMVLVYLSLLYTAGVMVAWGTAHLVFFAFMAEGKSSLVPFVLWSYAVASNPWSVLSQHDGNEYSAMSTFFFRTGYVVAMALLLFVGSLPFAAGGMALIILMNFMMQAIDGWRGQGLSGEREEV